MKVLPLFPMLIVYSAGLYTFLRPPALTVKCFVTPWTSRMPSISMEILSKFEMVEYLIKGIAALLRSAICKNTP